MKYIIQESKLEKALNIYLDGRFKNSSIYEEDSFINVSDYYDDDDTITILEYDDGTLHIKKDFLKTTNYILPVGFEKLSELISLWFESKFDVKVDDYEYYYFL